MIGAVILVFALQGVGHSGSLDLDGDTDRNGIIDGTSGEESLEAKNSLIVLNNCDDDDRDSRPDNQDNVVNGSADRTDFDPIVLRRPQSAFSGAVVLRLVNLSDDGFQERQKVRVLGVGGAEIMGPSTSSMYALKSAEVKELATRDLTFLVEGLEFATSVKIAVFLDQVEQDELIVEVAPFLLVPHSLRATNNRVCHFNDPESDAFVQSFRSACAKAGVEATVIEEGDVWIQDELTWGFTETPRLKLPVALHMHRERALADDVRRLLKPDIGYFEAFAHPSTPNSLDYGGNLEVTPPSPRFPFGRVYYGSLKSQGDPVNAYNSRAIDRGYQGFFKRQKLQEPIDLCTDWLRVGHVDEIISFVPKADGSYMLLLASPKQALEILRDLPPATPLDERYRRYNVRTVGDFFNLRYLLRSFESYNMDVDAKLYGADHDRPDPGSIKRRLMTALDLAESDVHEVPTLFENVGTNRVWAAVALNPGMVNLSSMGRFSLVAEPFFPAFKEPLESLLSRAGLTPSFIDDWEIYHISQGEVHCGSNQLRDPFARKWWQ